MHDESVPIRPYTLLELARLYEVSRWTFKKWIEPHEDAIGPRVGYFFTTLQVKVIFEKLGPPSSRMVA
jgi:hypothetical protein